VKSVRPAFEAFYATLSVEQKAQLVLIGSGRAGSGAGATAGNGQGLRSIAATCNWNQDMIRNVLYLVIGALVFAAGVFGYMLYQERQKTTGIEINVGKSGVSIEKK
jgi:hypothetical protein